MSPQLMNNVYIDTDILVNSFPRRGFLDHGSRRSRGQFAVNANQRAHADGGNPRSQGAPFPNDNSEPTAHSARRGDALGLRPSMGQHLRELSAGRGATRSRLRFWSVVRDECSPASA
jgi:hypothetical protein